MISAGSRGGRRLDNCWSTHGLGPSGIDVQLFFLDASEGDGSHQGIWLTSLDFATDLRLNAALIPDDRDLKGRKQYRVWALAGEVWQKRKRSSFIFRDRSSLQAIASRLRSSLSGCWAVNGSIESSLGVCSSEAKGVDLTCVRPAVRPLARPYLRPASFLRRVGHVDGPAVQGGPTRLARGGFGLVPSRSSGTDQTEQELKNLNGAEVDPTERELGNWNGVGAAPTERELRNLNSVGADPTGRELGNWNGVGVDPTEHELENLNSAGADPTEQELGNLNGAAGADPTEQELGNCDVARADPTKQELENLNGAVELIRPSRSSGIVMSQ
ncbi:hypothetical protein BHM03_00034574 [Ensete ventricosum]|nr:hypothetical protein BHM03_00034574 [Ensete ventricosum]